MPLILALDAAAGPCSAAISKDGRLVASMREETPHTQAARLIPLVEDCLQQAKCSYADLDAIAVTVGPGSFTGIRIGLAAARGLALAARKPLRGVSTLALLAYQTRQATVTDGIDGIIAAMVAGKGQLFLQVFDMSLIPQAVTTASATNIADVATVLPAQGRYLVCGSGIKDITTVMDTMLELQESPAHLPDAATLALLACHYSGKHDAGKHAIYLRAADAKLPPPK